jgi:DNA-directed RNA polymerase specialized sigma24 family protein
LLSQQTGAGFRTTRWTLLGLLRSGGAAERRQAMDTVIREYWPAAYAYLRRAGCGRDEASELTQAFFAEVVLGRGLLNQADPSKGRVRSLLCAALKNFRLDKARRDSARRRRVMSVSDEEVEREEHLLSTAAPSAPEEAFERRWALAALERALRRCEEYYRAKGLARNWEAFAARVLHPRLGQCEPASPARLAEEFGFGGPADVAAAVQVVKRKLELLLHEEASAGSDRDDSGYQRLFSLLS